MSGPQPRRLSRDELLPLAVAFEHRRQAFLGRRPLLVPPLPDCPDCGAAPGEVAVSDGPFALDEIRTIFRPCGHGFTADAQDVYEASRDAARIVDGDDPGTSS